MQLLFVWASTRCLFLHVFVGFSGILASSIYPLSRRNNKTTRSSKNARIYPHPELGSFTLRTRPKSSWGSKGDRSICHPPSPGPPRALRAPQAELARIIRDRRDGKKSDGTGTGALGGGAAHVKGGHEPPPTAWPSENRKARGLVEGSS